MQTAARSQLAGGFFVWSDGLRRFAGPRSEIGVLGVSELKTEKALH